MACYAIQHNVPFLFPIPVGIYLSWDCLESQLPFRWA